METGWIGMTKRAAHRKASRIFSTAIRLGIYSLYPIDVVRYWSNAGPRRYVLRIYNKRTGDERWIYE